MYKKQSFVNTYTHLGTLVLMSTCILEVRTMITKLVEASSFLAIAPELGNMVSFIFMVLISVSLQHNNNVNLL